MCNFLNHGITEDVFFHWFIFVFYLILPCWLFKCWFLKGLTIYTIRGDKIVEELPAHDRGKKMQENEAFTIIKRSQRRVSPPRIV